MAIVQNKNDDPFWLIPPGQNPQEVERAFLAEALALLLAKNGGKISLTWEDRERLPARFGLDFYFHVEVGDEVYLDIVDCSPGSPSRENGEGA